MTSQLDQTRSEKFAGRMMGILNGGMLSLMTSIGYRAGLFELPLADFPSRTRWRRHSTP